jgi:hypothetical protein
LFLAGSLFVLLFEAEHGSDIFSQNTGQLLRDYMASYPRSFLFFFIRIRGRGGIQLGPLGTAATNSLIMPAPGDYDGGEIGRIMIGKGNRSTRRKPAPVSLCSPETPDALPGLEPGPPRWEASD